MVPTVLAWAKPNRTRIEQLIRPRLWLFDILGFSVPFDHSLKGYIHKHPMFWDCKALPGRSM